MPAPAAAPEVATAKQALALLRRRGLVTLTGTPGLFSLVEAVAGGPIRGSWWGHPKGGVIFRIAGELEDDPAVLVAKLVAGKITFVHGGLWPALFRVVSDDGWRAPRIARLAAAERRLFDEVEARGEVRPEDRRAAKGALEKSLLVLSAEVHTASGSHATVLTSWRRWATPELVSRAKALSLEGALGELRSRAGGAPLAVDDAPPPGRARRQRGS